MYYVPIVRILLARLPKRLRARSIWVAAGCVIALVAGVIAAVATGSPPGPADSSPRGAAAAPLPRVAPSNNAQVVPGYGIGADFADPAVRLAARSTPTVAPLRTLRQADLLIVAPSSLSSTVFYDVLHHPGVSYAEQIDAVRMRINDSYAAVLGVNPSQFRSFAERPTASSNALWDGVAAGGIAVSYTMGTMDRLTLGGTVSAAGSVTEKLRVAAFGTVGVGGVDAVVSTGVARSLGMPTGNAIVVSASSVTQLSSLASALEKLLPKGVVVELLVRVVQTGTAGSSGSSDLAGSAGSATSTELTTMIRAAESRVGMPYVWGAAGPTSFDCSGLVQWSFAQAGVRMPRVAADQALTGPSVSISGLEPGDLLFYHTDPSAPDYISHVAIYLGNGWMIQAPRTGLDVEIVPADFGSEFAGAISVNTTLAAEMAVTEA